ncbi:MAG: translation elongation factor Ts [Cyclobacteriaceae bacterium]|nr:elongation factor Ts [Cyclobacteriaceae bacterium]MCH8515976.1 translation elongation factor Ts [Cyclobacteriaceae bacterium]
MAISAKQVNELRKKTGAGMMDCKKALVESDGDMEGAIEILRKKGQKVSASRADRETTEGAVFAKTSSDNTFGAIIGLGCETDFVAKNEEFLALGEAIVTQAFENKPATKEDLLKLKVGELAIEEKIVELVGKIGEKIQITAYETMEAESVVTYIHAGSKLGVLLAMANVNGADVTEAGRDVAMQIAAMNPVAVDKDGVDASVIEKEIEIGKDLARQEGKPEEMLEKIAQGKLNKFFKENTLLPQGFVKDNKLSVQQYLDSVQKGLTVTEFKRVSLS